MIDPEKISARADWLLENKRVNLVCYEFKNSKHKVDDDEQYYINRELQELIERVVIYCGASNGIG